jgi:hypothetical protein
MPYVPGYKHDLFLSYARAESEWVDAFRVALSRSLQDKVGHAVALWQDVRNIRFGQDWPDEIQKGIRDSAAFLAICSPSYFDSEWCAREYDTFAPNGRLEGLKVGSFYRFLKAIKTPDADKLHQRFYEESQSIEFFNKSDEEYGLGSREFFFEVCRAATAIFELLRTMRNGKQALYVATAASDMQEEWKQLRDQLLDYGYDVRPRVRITPAFKGLVEEELERSLLAIFLLGGVEDDFVGRQMRAAKDLGRRLIVWAHPRKSKEKQTDLLARILEGAPHGSQVLGGSSIRDFIHDLVELLASRPESVPAASDKTRRNVYLMHDTNQRMEVERAAGLRRLIREQQMTVQPDANLTLTPDNHECFMRECDGLLLYRGEVSGPDKWLFQNLSQVQFAEKMYDLKEPLKAKTLLLANPAQVAGVPGLDVLPYCEPLTHELLRPFFDKMRQGMHARAGN